MNFTTSYSGASFRLDQDILIKQCRNLYGSGLMQIAHTHYRFDTPCVYGLGDDHIAMQYMKDSMTLPAFFNICDKPQVESIIKDIYGFVCDNKKSKTVFIRPDVIIAKITHIIGRLNDYEDIQLASQLAAKFGHGPIEIEVGCYHGDLTFSNILVNNKDYTDLYLIDFLPGYVPSHYLDIVKLQQEVNLSWSKYFIHCGGNYDYAINLLRPRLDEYFNGANGKTLRLMEALNYLRILPYTSGNPIIKNVLRVSIKNILAQ